MIDSLISVSAIVAAIASILSAFISALTIKRARRNLGLRLAKIYRAYASLLGSEGDLSERDLFRFRDELKTILSGITDALSEISGKPVFGSVKLLSQEDGQISVQTFIRDEQSAANREVLGRSYPLEASTPYSQIFSQEAERFVVNNLEDAFETHRDIYKNFSDWKPSYKSILVLPLLTGDGTTIGLLSFDSPKKNAFPEAAVDMAQNLSPLLSKLLERTFKHANGSEMQNV